MADGVLSKGTVRSLSDGGAVDARVTVGRVRVIDNFPSEEGRFKTASLRSLNDGEATDARLTRGIVRTLIRGRVDDPKVRVWTYTLDGHDYYVMRLGNVETLVYDTHSQQWSVFGSFTSDLWKPFNGQNWLGADFLADRYGSNIVVGDDANGSLYFLNPEAYKDDDAVEGADLPKTFERIFQGQLQKRNYDYEKCFAVELLGSIGKMDDPTLTSITLYYSDNKGVDYVNAGSVTINNEDYGKRVDWRSLGSFTAPGRLFKIVDEGSLHRIDSLTADTDKER